MFRFVIYIYYRFRYLDYFPRMSYSGPVSLTQEMKNKNKTQNQTNKNTTLIFCCLKCMYDSNMFLGLFYLRISGFYLISMGNECKHSHFSEHTSLKRGFLEVSEFLVCQIKTQPYIVNCGLSVEHLTLCKP